MRCSQPRRLPGLAQVGGRIDIDQDSRVVAFQQLDLGAMPLEYGACAVIAAELHQLVAEPRGKPDRMASAPR